jgi:hypothetical protein
LRQAVLEAEAEEVQPQRRARHDARPKLSGTKPAARK